MRLKAFRTKNKEYMHALEEYNTTLKKRLYTQNNEEGPPTRPIFQVILKEINFSYFLLKSIFLPFSIVFTKDILNSLKYIFNSNNY